MQTPPASAEAEATVAVSPSRPPPAAVILAPEELAPYFPNYEILRILGRGGMGAVYLARQVSLNRLVAIKILPAELDDGKNHFVQRFKNEAQAMAQLNHPGIVAVYDFGQAANGQLYIVMEYVDGTDVSLMVARQGRLHSAQAMAITAHVCDALAYAHTRGIVHRDIKPSNIMVRNDGVVKVADFGLAKMNDTQATGLTQSGMAMGTLHFMAPEVLTLGSAVDQRADIYAVGVMLYQMLTGKLPQGMFEMPSFQVPGLDPRYDKIVAKALRDDRELRYQAARDLRHDLDAILTQPVEKVTPEASVPVAALPPVAQRERKATPQRLPRIEVETSAETTVVAARKGFSGLLPFLAGAGVLVVAGWFFFGRHPNKPGDVPATLGAAPAVFGPDTAHATPTKKAEEASVDHPFENSQGMRFVPVPGTQVMFCIHETRYADYAAYAAQNPGLNTQWKAPQKDGIALKTEGGCPVVNVTSEEAKGFCDWLSRKEGRTYRLPTDEEWSWAVGIGKQEGPGGGGSPWGLYPWGTQWPPPAGAGNLADSTWTEAFHEQTQIPGYTDGYPGPAPVMSFKPNFLGLYDLAGNVMEFCSNGSDPQHVLGRGGHWTSARPAGDVRSATRVRIDNPGTIRGHGFGFRCVVETAPPVKPNTPDTAHAKTTTKIEEASIEHPFENSLGMKFVPVPISGGPTDGKWVLFSIWDTRVQDYRAFAEEMQHEVEKPDFPQTDDQPAVMVSWNDAKAFCTWLTARDRKAGKIGTGDTYRLPSDHEWSCAVGIGDREDANAAPSFKRGQIENVYPWGTQWPPPKGAGNYGDRHKEVSNFKVASPVGSFAANALGLYDMAGNARQWCEDVYRPGEPSRVQRGGGWRNGDRTDFLSSFRLPCLPTNRINDYGFRCVVEPAAANTAHAKTTTKMEEASIGHPFENSLGMRFVPVPGTKVLFSIWDTRVMDYEAYAKANPGENGPWRAQKKDGVPAGSEPEHPVVGVSWDDAKAFCNWLTRAEAGRLPQGMEYRLPGDEEWSRAAGLPEEDGATPEAKVDRNNVDFPWGTEWPLTKKTGNYADETFHANFAAVWNEKQKREENLWVKGYTDGYATTSPVGAFPANVHGLHDMGGNVWQWCEGLVEHGA